jgi:hypothetical protein
VIEAFKMVDDAIPIDEHLLWIALEEVVKENSTGGSILTAGMSVSASSAGVISGSLQSVMIKRTTHAPSVRRNTSARATSATGILVTCVQTTRGITNGARTATAVSDATENGWSICGATCARRSSHGVSTTQWAECELNPVGTVSGHTAQTIYTPPHGFKMSLKSGELAYDHNGMIWV